MKAISCTRLAAASARRCSPSRYWAKPTAFTVVETLVTLSALSLLAALLLPAVQRSREGARRSRCLNNLREIVHACGSHESALGEFPYTAIQYLGTDNKVHPPCSPHERILSYIEQESVSAQIDPADYPLDVAVMPPFSMHNAGLVHLTLSVFLCPTDSGLGGGNNYRACMGWGPGIFTPDQTGVCTDPANGTGAFVNGRAVKPAEFLDGLSNTVMFSERVMGRPGTYRPYSDYRVYLGNICSTADAVATCGSISANGLYDSYAGATWLFGGWRQTWYNHILTPNSAIPDCNAGPISSGGGSGAYTARSYHPGGVNSAMADGSAHFVSDHVDARIWRAISTRRGAEAFNVSDLD